MGSPRCGPRHDRAPFPQNGFAELIGLGVLAEEAFVLGDGDVAQHGGLAGEPETLFRLMGRESKPPKLDRGGLGDRPFHAHRAGAAGAVAAAMDRARHPGVERKPGVQQDHREIGPGKTLDRLTGEADLRHLK